MAEAALATLADWEERLAEVGVSIRNVAGGALGCPRISPVNFGPDSPLVLVVTCYALTPEGKRYVDWEQGNVAAIEVRRFFITKDFRLTPAPPLDSSPADWAPGPRPTAVAMEEALTAVEETTEHAKAIRKLGESKR